MRCAFPASDEDFDDDEMCSGADVEFVAETQEEQEKLKERMTSANQHMEDSVVAAYAGRSVYFSINSFTVKSFT